ncbi:hypothetical protein [Pseudoroseicyclus tamaricis]|uniref:Uncharacterized protein n=1 Tax=Pseudoroseicyclus tamaricis TaxID=2705421 RepID=A0A6B2JJB0_9RHOB|nr:hypothetical protein [Pseudoroseicyclus tamaricis]NDV01513.1 hypothetical protein [Pseudoroseicyclus tamaricis]
MRAFLSNRHTDVVEPVTALIEENPSELQAQNEMIRLCDLALRSAFMMQDRPAAERLLKHAGVLSPLSHFRAALAFEDGDRKMGWAWMANASYHSKSLHFFASLGLNSAVRNPNWPLIARGDGITFQEPEVEVQGEGREARYAIVFSTDSGYLKRFLPQSLGSLRARCTGYLAVYHVIEPDAEAMELMRAHAGDDVIFFIERKAQLADRSYYASARFFAARRVIQDMGLPAFVFDIDMRCEKDFAELLDHPRFAPRKMQIRLMRGMSLPWHRIIAHAVYAPATPQALAYLTLICDYVRLFFSRSHGEDLWWIDQNAMFFSYLQRPPGEFANLPGKLLKEHLTFPKMFEDKDKALQSP